MSWDRNHLAQTTQPHTSLLLLLALLCCLQATAWSRKGFCVILFEVVLLLQWSQVPTSQQGWAESHSGEHTLCNSAEKPPGGVLSCQGAMGQLPAESTCLASSQVSLCWEQPLPACPGEPMMGTATAGNSHCLPMMGTAALHHGRIWLMGDQSVNTELGTVGTSPRSEVL